MLFRNVLHMKTQKFVKLSICKGNIAFSICTSMLNFWLFMRNGISNLDFLEFLKKRNCVCVGDGVT